MVSRLGAADAAAAVRSTRDIAIVRWVAFIALPRSGFFFVLSIVCESTDYVSNRQIRQAVSTGHAARSVDTEPV